jgi:hypothetical protein
MIKTILIFLFIGIVLNASSQQKIPLQHQDFNEEFYVLEDNKIKPKLEIVYYWFKAREVHHSYGACEGKPLDGEYKSFYKSHQLRSKGEFKNGVKTAEWTYWNEAGLITKQEHFRNGVLHGDYSELIEDSLVKNKYKSGVLRVKVNKDKPKELEVVNMPETTEKEKKASLWSRIFSKDKSQKNEEEEEPIKKQEE